MTEAITQFFDNSTYAGPMHRVLTQFNEPGEGMECFCIFVQAGVKRAELMPKPVMVRCNQQTVVNHTRGEGQLAPPHGPHLYIVLHS